MASISTGLRGLSLDVGTNGIEAFRAGRGTYLTKLPQARQSAAPERGFGKADFIGAEQHVFVRDRQRCQQNSRVAPQPRKISGRKALEWREIRITFSRPVSKLIRRTFSCGRDLSVLVSSAI
jgi:hypothetical protein